MSTQAVSAGAARRRARRFALFTLLLGAAVPLLFLRGTSGGVATFVLNDARGERFPLPDLVIPVDLTLALLAAAIVAVGVLQLVRPVGRRAPLAVGAAGWYTWPDTQAAWPAGLGGSAEALGQPIDLDAFLQLPMVLWVGERDNVADRLLRSDPGLVEQQGAHRLERAQRWAAAVRAAARARGLHQPAPVRLLSQVGHDFAACHRRGDMAGQVMDFFDQHRARP
jgi:hypothetical protein